jgi:hypothetical protein
MIVRAIIIIIKTSKQWYCSAQHIRRKEIAVLSCTYHSIQKTDSKNWDLFNWKLMCDFTSGFFMSYLGGNPSKSAKAHWESFPNQDSWTQKKNKSTTCFFFKMMKSGSWTHNDKKIRIIFNFYIVRICMMWFEYDRISTISFYDRLNAIYRIITRGKSSHLNSITILTIYEYTL